MKSATLRGLLAIFFGSVLLMAIASHSAATAAESVLAPGNPPLTQGMVDRLIKGSEFVLEIRLTQDQRDRLQRALIGIWISNDQDGIRDSLSDLQYYSQADTLRASRANQLINVEAMRRNGASDSLILLEAYDAAHPNRIAATRAKGLADLIGVWTLGDALVPSRNPLTHGLMGTGFAESLGVQLFADGRFSHGWAHEVCSYPSQCCHKYGTEEMGKFLLQGSRLVFQVEAGQTHYSSGCALVPATASARNEALPPRTERAVWWIQRDANNARMLCMSTQPFQVSKPSSKVYGSLVCYVEKR